MFGQRRLYLQLNRQLPDEPHRVLVTVTCCESRKGRGMTYYFTDGYPEDEECSLLQYYMGMTGAADRRVQGADLEGQGSFQ